MAYDLTRILRWCVPLIFVYLASEIMLAAHVAWMLSYLYDLEAGTAEAATADQIDEFGMLLSPFFFIALISAHVANGIWIYRATANARAIAPEDGRITPGWAVGWYFVPIVNLWMPYKAMRQTWNSSIHGVAGSMDAPAAARLGLWWGCWIIAGTLGNIAWQMERTDDSVATLIAVSWMNLATIPFSIGAGLLFLGLIKEITRAQTESGGIAETFS
ncbi:MAG: DUF4328 domain-containing protein [Pseudomonadota bacterium]